MIKGKSMISEEMDLNHRLQGIGVEAVETDLGEYIIQLAEETPFHIVAPAIHKSREDVADLFHDKLGAPRYTEITDMAAEARAQLREKFMTADMGITGANFMVAETGTVVLVTNEGNGRMCTSMPRVHVAIAGMEKVVPSIEDLGTMLRLLIRSATGQTISSYVTAVTGPRGADEEDGPEEFHLVIVGQWKVEDARGPAASRSPVLPPMRRMPECLPGLPKGRRPRLRVGLQRAYRGRRLPHAQRAFRRKRPAIRLQSLRSMPRGVPGQDRHTQDAPLHAQGGLGRRDLS